MSDLAEFLSAYIQEALASTSDESNESGGFPLEKTFDESAVDAATKKQMLQDCDRFMRTNKALLEASGLSIEEQARKFWLDRNGHGTGFWDVDDYKNPEAVKNGKALSSACKKFGEFYIYVGDDGYIHGSGGRVTPEKYNEASVFETLAHAVVAQEGLHPILVEIQKALKSLEGAPYRETMDYYLGNELKALEEFDPLLRKVTTKLRTGGPSDTTQPKPAAEKPQEWMSQKTTAAPGRMPTPPKSTDKDATLKLLQKVKKAMTRLGEPDLLPTLQQQVGKDFKKLVELSQLLTTTMQKLQTSR